MTNSSDSVELGNSGLNNEFFARACLEWQDRLAEGEFTPENQQKLKLEADRERSRLDPWKLKHFEPIWGDKSDISLDRPPIKTTIKLRPTTSIATTVKPKTVPPPVKRLRTVGAMTRSCTTNLKECELNQSEIGPNKTPIPDLLPINKPIRPRIVGDEVNEAEKIENNIINISQTILQTDEETIITTCCNKRQRSHSRDSEQEICSKRKTPSPHPSSSSSIESPKIDEKGISETFIEEKASEDVNTSSILVIATTKSEEQEETKDNEEISDVILSQDEEKQNGCQNNNITKLASPDQQEIDEEYEDESEEEQEDELIENSFPILPSSLILQEESMVLEKTCAEICEVGDICIEAEKLEASVEESDLVMAQLSQDNFETVSHDVDANEDRFIDAENYVLESGQITVVEGAKDKQRTEVDIQATLFGGETTPGQLKMFEKSYFIVFFDQICTEFQWKH